MRATLSARFSSSAAFSALWLAIISRKAVSACVPRSPAIVFSVVPRASW